MGSESFWLPQIHFTNPGSSQQKNPHRRIVAKPRRPLIVRARCVELPDPSLQIRKQRPVWLILRKFFGRKCLNQFTATLHSMGFARCRGVGNNGSCRRRYLTSVR